MINTSGAPIVSKQAAVLSCTRCEDRDAEGLSHAVITVPAIKARDQLVTVERTKATEACDLSVAHVIPFVHSCNSETGTPVLRATVAGSGWADLVSHSWSPHAMSLRALIIIDSNMLHTSHFMPHCAHVQAAWTVSRT